jgi:hypothetical protein
LPPLVVDEDRPARDDLLAYTTEQIIGLLREAEFD